MAKKEFSKSIAVLLVLFVLSALLLTGIALCLVGAAVNGWLGILLAVAGFIVVVAGLGYVHHGYTHHEVVEKQD